MGVESHELKRTDICPTPESELFESVANNETNKIRNLVLENPRLLSTVYGHPYDRPILYIACYEFAEDSRVLPSTVQTLIDLGADLYYFDPADDNKEALHFAVLSQNPSILEVVIRNVKDQGINATTNGNTALNLLVKKGASDTKDFEKCLKLLLSAGVNVNKADGRNITPILWAAHKGYKNAVGIILNNSSFVDIDTHTFQQKTARQLIEEKGLYDGDLPERTAANNNECAKDILFRYIKEGKEDEFVQFPDLESHVDDEEDEGTLLQLACRLNRRKIVNRLIENYASLTKCTQKNRALPIEIAANGGYHKIFGALLSEHTHTKIPDDVLPTLLLHAGNYASEEVDDRKCLEALLGDADVRIDVNAKNSSGNTALHFSTRYADPDTTLNLLKRGASLGNKNRYGFLPIEDIDASTLEEHFDNCVGTEPKTKVDKQGTILTFDYKTLLPTTDNLSEDSKQSDVESNLLFSEFQDIVSETDVVYSMSKTPELRHLLKHPLITSFLYIKWYRMRSFFYMNLAFYMTFCLSLALYISLIYNSNLLKDHPGFAGLLSVFLVVMFVLLASRELFQVIVSPRTYVLQFENWIEIALALVTSLILFLNSPQPDTVRQLSSTAILLAALEMMLLIGQHPKMSTNIVMLRTVSYNFFKFLLWYAILILAFALSFYILFNKETGRESPANSTSKDEEDDEQDFFVDPSLTIIKTIVMLTGEFDASSINFEPLPNRIIFLLFVFMIAIILFNLLNGLAVSDTQMIKSDAEIVAHVERINHIVYIENMMLGNLIPTNLLLPLQKLCCCFQTDTLRSLSAPRPLAKLMFLFPHFLKGRRLQVFLNQEGKVIERRDENGCFKKCGGVFLDKQTIKRVKTMLHARQIKQRVVAQSELLKQKEDLIRDLQQIIKSQQETIGRLAVN